jgi:hypothetical protein
MTINTFKKSFKDILIGHLDPRHYVVDPDSTCHPDADPTHHPNADSDPSFQKKAQTPEKC